MEKEQLETILKCLNDLADGVYLAKRTKDRRKRDRAIREAYKDVADYATFIPLELKAIFDKQVGANSLNYQHADDISQCIEIVNKLIKEKDEIHDK